MPFPTSNQLQKVPGSPVRLFSHDAAGNQLNDGLRSYTWRNSGQLARVAYSGVVTDYTYNGFNQRLRKTSAGVTTYYSYDEAGHLQGEYAADGSLLAEHLWLGDTPVATVQRQADGSLATYYVFADHIDTPRALSDANGKILWRWDGEGFGRSPPDADADGDGVALTYNLRFLGQVFDKESNLHYNWNRYYDPVTGRYLSSDPIGLAGGINTYLYAGADPLTQIDLLGLANGPAVGWSKLLRPTPVSTPISLQIGAGGFGNVGPFVCSGDSGLAVDTTGAICFYTNTCSGYGWNTVGGGSIGVTGAVGTGSLSSGPQISYGGYWYAGVGLGGEGQITGTSSGAQYGRGVVGITAGGGVGYVKCEQRFYCINR